MKKSKKTHVQAKKKTASAAIKKPVAPTPKMEKVQAAPYTPFSWLLMISAALFIVHSLVIYVANLMFPNEVVLGTDMISPMAAVVYSMAVFTLIAVAVMPAIEAYQNSQNMRLSNIMWTVVYLFVNFAGLWMIGRFAAQLGLGLSSWMVVATLAIVLDIFQGITIVSMMSKMK